MRNLFLLMTTALPTRLSSSGCSADWRGWRMNVRPFAAFLSVLGVVAAARPAAAQAPPAYELVDLHESVGGDWSEAYDVNDHGAAVLRSNSSGTVHGHVWREDTGAVELVDGGWHYLIPQAINDSGTIAGFGLSKSPFGLRGFVRLADGTTSRLGSGSSSYPSNYAFGLNDSGWAVGYGPSSGGGNALLWWPPGYGTLAVLSGTAYFGRANDANDFVQGDGQPAPVVVGARMPSSERQASAVCWGCSGSLHAPTVIGGLEPGSFSEALGVNNLNYVVGRSCPVDPICKAFLWRPGLGSIELPGLPDSTNTRAYDVNSRSPVSSTTARPTA
jgi:hypothetical protein